MAKIQRRATRKVLEEEPMDDLEWEEWDGKGSWLSHVIAGSCAGMAEHGSMFPVDTVKTHMQCGRCMTTPNLTTQSALQTMRGIVKAEGASRLWRGVTVNLAATIPAHAGYFSVFEYCKERFGADQPGHHPAAAAAAGAFSAVFHDSIMTPTDVVKQRLQLGHYLGPLDCIKTVLRQEGFAAFYLSFPTTLVMNIPYTCVMVAINESVKEVLNPSGGTNIPAFMVAGGIAGSVAAAVTNPLDVAKTRLQTQHIVDQGATCIIESSTGHAAHSQQYKGLVDVMKQIYAFEGMAGFMRGVGPRMLYHTPSVAVSWTAYETIKRYLTTQGI